jgi:hypothetical protein
MPETKAEMVIRLRREADSAELHSRQLLSIAARFGKGRHYDIAIEDARATIAEAISLREQADRLQSEDQI